ncbi:MAG TPA: hypothetical protein VIL58_00765 [Thermoplasmata archaeon]|nr:hypothetical protein [Thermoplasmata archaeon]
MREIGTMETSDEPGGKAWKKFVRRHWKMTLSMVGGIAVAAVASLLIFLWVVADAQTTGLVPSGLGEWTVGYVLTFILSAILWELVLVASWVIPIVVAAYFLWYKKLPDEERREYEGGPRRSRSAGENGGISFFIGLVWFVIVWTDGKWNLAFQDWTFNDWVYSWIAAGLVVLLLAGIPAMTYIIWSLRRNR